MKFCILLLVFGSSQVVIEEIPNYGSPPPAVLTSSLVYYDNVIYMFGGFYKKNSNELWTYDVAKNIWSNILSGSQAIPSPRNSAILVGANKKIYLYGGDTYIGANGDLWAFDIVSTLWELLSPTGDLPIPRNQPSYVSDKSSTLYLFGGTTSFGSDSALYK